MFSEAVAARVLLILLLALAIAPASARPAGTDVYNGKKITQPLVAWQVVIYLGMRGPSEGLLCGGTVIAPHWILTAAHCFRSKGGERIPKGLLAISQGSTALTAGRHQVNIKEIIEHPHYVFDTWDNDIALVYTDTPMSVVPIALATARQQPTGRLLVVGWGQTEVAVVSVNLLYTDIPTIPNDECGKLPEFKDRLTERLMCAGRTGADSCHGDSGGPLYSALAGGGGLQYGITVGGEGCGKLPGVYTRVASFRPWIEQVLEPTSSKLKVAQPVPAIESDCNDAARSSTC